MRKFILSLLIGFFFLPCTANAAVTFSLNDVRAVIDADNTVQVGKNIILDASQSFLPDEEEPVNYEWNFGDGSPKVDGIEVVHSYEESGEYLVTLTVTQANQTSTIARSIVAYEKLILFLTDVTDRQESVAKLTQKALEEGTYVNVIESYDSTTAFMSEEALSKKLVD